MIKYKPLRILVIDGTNMVPKLTLQLLTASKENTSFDVYAGRAGGSLAAILLASGAEPADILELIEEINLYLKEVTPNKIIGLIKDIFGMAKYNTTAFVNWLHQRIYCPIDEYPRYYCIPTYASSINEWYEYTNLNTNKNQDSVLTDEIIGFAVSDGYNFPTAIHSVLAERPAPRKCLAQVTLENAIPLVRDINTDWSHIELMIISASNCESAQLVQGNPFDYWYDDSSWKIPGLYRELNHPCNDQYKSVDATSILRELRISEHIDLFNYTKLKKEHPEILNTPDAIRRLNQCSFDAKLRKFNSNDTNIISIQ